MAIGTIKSESAIRFLQGMRREVKLAATFAVGAMAQRTKGHCADMLSLTDHTQKQLDALDHPYAKRHGPQGSSLHDPFQQVHTQSGDLLGGLEAVAPRATAAGATASVRNTDEKDVWIQLGTPTMIARPYMAYVRTAQAEDIQAAGAAELERRLAQVKGK